MSSVLAFGQDSTRRAPAKDTAVRLVDTLKSVTVTAVLRPRMKGDTTEYNTENIRLRANANVEELLGRLPGLLMDANGNITYNGEKIQHLLVDGEDIFGDNPTLVTRNFDASKVARVQVLDRKTDQALFKGIDDGTRVKTINLVLNESAKAGYFGKLEAGGNTDGYYSGNAVLADFNKREQFTALGLAANTGTLVFTNNAEGGAGGVYFQSAGGDPLGATAGAGVPQFSGTALHYANSWNRSGTHVLANYQFSQYHTEPVTTIQTLQSEPGSLYNQRQHSSSVNQQEQHWGYGVYDWAASKASAFKFALRGSSAAGQNELYSADSGSFNDTLVNASQRRIHDKVSQQSFGADANWRTSNRLTDRSLSVGFSVATTNNATRGYLYSINSYYQNGGTSRISDTIDQRKQINGNPLKVSGSFSYTEPIWKGALLGASYGITDLSDNTIQASFARGDGKYQEIVDSLSSHFQTQTITQRGLLNLQGKFRQLEYTLGIDWVLYSYRQKDLMTNSALHQHYLNWAPRIMLNYTRDPATKFRFLYTELTQQPSIAQLQPVKSNNDPLHLTLGNPILRPSFNRNVQIEFHHLKTWLINLNLYLGLISNSISNRTVTDSLGRQVSQPVNVDGGRTTGFNFAVNRKVFGFEAGLQAAFNYSHTVNYVNSILNGNSAYTGSGNFSLTKNVPDKYFFQMITAFTYFEQRSSINITAPLRYWSQNHYGALTIYLLHNIEINTNASYSWQQKTSSFAANTSALLWNVYFGRILLENKLVIKVQWNNIFNQSSGISRSNFNNVNTETSTNILGRYWMLSAAYHFDKKFKKK